jgi:hypothetical protein
VQGSTDSEAVFGQARSIEAISDIFQDFEASRRQKTGNNFIRDFIILQSNQKILLFLRELS